MKTTKLKIVLTVLMVAFTSFAFSACTKKSKTAPIEPTPTPKLLELEAKDKPYISLTPRQDGHELKLKIINIPDFVEQIEYELIYLAVDEDIEMEKGVGDTIKVTSSTIERDLLLGTASCTNGCKYKYDTGVTGGTLSLSLITSNNQVATFETPFTLTAASDLKTLSVEDFSVSATTKTKDFFVVLRNYGTKDKSTVSSIYSIFSSGSGSGKISSVSPQNATKDDKNIISGDYLIN